MRTDEIRTKVMSAFEIGGVTVEDVEVRAYPNEINVLVFVAEGGFSRAIELAEGIEEQIHDPDHPMLVVVRRAQPDLSADDQGGTAAGVQASSAATLQRVILARSRVSEVQPSLSYVRDLTENLATITATRHHLVFGRRGAGKSTLLVEARRRLEGEHALTAWINLQPLRRDEPSRVFLRIVREMLSTVVSNLIRERSSSEIVPELTRLLDLTASLIQSDILDQTRAERLIPDVQRSLRRALIFLDRDLFVFVDDFYYVPRADQPAILDMLHGCTRDSKTWLKIASIRHLTRWFVTSPPTGLQTGHDADIVDLDVTLEQPRLVRRFLISILTNYAAEAGVTNLHSVFRPTALDRLVLASGGVPRDFLILAAAGITKARGREGARLVGVQEVNQAAGEAAAVKIQELEEDLASNAEDASRSLQALTVMRTFCLEETASTYYRVDFFDKEEHPGEYRVFTDLLDLRLVHLVHASVSDGHEAGRRYEVFMLDLSQFSGSRLKQGIRVLDLDGDVLLMRRTRQSESERRAETPRQLLSILRAAPLFELDRLTTISDDPIPLPGI